MSRFAFVAVAGLSLSACGLFKSAPDPAEGFTVPAGLELTLWASEPDVINPTNIDIDERGRIWVTEAINYRRQLKELPDLVAEGDRILILEDTDGDGRADSRKVFDQSPQLRSPLGIAVLGDKVYVSQSPDVFVYTKDENDKIISKETLLTGFGGIDHDHGVHAVTFGHDGRLYFDMGDRTFDVTGKGGRRVVSSPDGPFYAGAVLRMNPDGTDLTVLAHNFRNPYEMAQDSFGTIWQTDNDDDGNKWTRLNYVMEGGNFGYWGPGGKKWREDHGTHFHHELPGVTPDIARTGAGSPTGVIVYEGDLLPEKYRGNLIHSEPGKRRVYAFLLADDGAGYKMQAEELVSTDLPNFRPSDVAVAPDGSVFIADWYDPVVGGHNMLDHEMGRIYRLAPPNSPREEAPSPDLGSVNGLAAALRSPNQATRYQAFTALRAQGQGAIPALMKLWSEGDAVTKARALWLLATTGVEGREPLDEALASDDPRMKILGMRVARFAGDDIVELVSPLVEDPSPQVRREAALALQYEEGERAIEPLAALARGYDGEDRWYLEALAIGARGKEEALAVRLEDELTGGALLDLLWQLKPRDALPQLSRAAHDSSRPLEERLKALRAIGDRAEPQAARTLAGFVSDSDAQIAAAAFDKLSRQMFSQWTAQRKDPVVVGAVRRALGSEAMQAAALELVADLGDPVYAPQVATLARSESADPEIRRSALVALGSTRQAQYVPLLAEIAAGPGDPELKLAALKGLAAARPRDLDDRLEALLLADNPPGVRSEALRTLARSDAGLTRVLDLEEAGDLPVEVKSLATSLAHRSGNEEIKARAMTVLPPPVDRANNRLPDNPYILASRAGNVDAGREVFRKQDGPKCATCHSLEDRMELAGPNLSAIGSKYDKRGLLDSLLNPSAGIAPEYYVYILDTQTQGLVIGVIAEDTAEQVLVRNEFGDEIRLKPEEISDRRKSDLSMMPEDIITTMSEQEIVDLLEFLSTLKADATTD